MFSSIEEAVTDLKNGKLIIVCDDEDRENEGDFIGLAAHATPEMIHFMAREGRGLICVPINEKLANKLDLPFMVTNSSDPRSTAFTVSIDHKDTSTGISAHERSLTIMSMLEENAVSSDFTRPGHIFPLIAKEGGVLTRNGHTEAAVDLAILAGEQPVSVICEILNDDGTMARVNDLRKIADKFQMKMITIKDLIQYQKEKR
ncbi:3,4-dihydroxy-2-butanone-4-phosphate synthase [Bacillus sp. B1-b2]|nr:3,4-dihydroxy-2-butanone-4-phosphate synthase [Bacillus sp. B1-b2]